VLISVILSVVSRAIKSIKPDIRPIGISDVLVKIAEKEAIELNLDDIIKNIDKSQIGIGVKGGAEAMIDMHRRAIWYMKNYESNQDDNEDEKDDIFYSLLNADLENCFNSMDQEKGLELTARKVPNLYPMEEGCDWS